jgi:hypothetical protein
VFTSELLINLNRKHSNKTHFNLILKKRKISEKFSLLIMKQNIKFANKISSALVVDDMVETSNNACESAHKETITQMQMADKCEKNVSMLLKEHLTNEMFGTILHAYHTPHIVLKIFLVLFLLIAVGLFSYTTVNLILSFLDYEVTTLSREFYETPVTFPKVSICNINTFTTKYSFDLFQQLNVAQNYTQNIYDDNLMKDLSRSQKFHVALTQKNILNGMAINFTDSEKKMLTHDLSDLLLNCQFNYEPCLVSDFLWEYDLNYGNCYSFNSGFNATGGTMALKQSNIAGNGFVFYFFVLFWGIIKTC